MNILVTGASGGIGRPVCERFLAAGHCVFGLDLLPSPLVHDRYAHHLADVTRPETFPALPPVEILVNNAGVQNADDIGVNLVGAMMVTEHYLSPSIRSVLNVASVAAHNGAEFPAYTASKGGLVAYTRNLAIRLARYGATCNSISPGGVRTRLNAPVMDDPAAWGEIMALTPLKKWATPQEIAEWVYFLTVVNQSATGIDVVIDNGESTASARFIWPSPSP